MGTSLSAEKRPSSLKAVHRNNFLKFGSGSGASDSASTCPTALVVVNGAALLQDGELKWTQRAWDSFDVKVCADGGSNRLYDAFETEEARASMIPDHIIGDLDSAREEVQAYYRSKGTTVTKKPSQDNMDLEKSLDLLCELQANPPSSSSLSSYGSAKMKVVVMGAFGGRFDQEMANCNCLFKYIDKFEGLVLLGGGNCATLLSGGKEVEHLIEMIPGFEGPGCSLLPIGSTASSVTTSGLNWDVDDIPLHFGGLVSSSNRAAKDNEIGGTISIKTSHPLIWSCDLAL